MLTQVTQVPDLSDLFFNTEKSDLWSVTLVLLSVVNEHELRFNKPSNQSTSRSKLKLFLIMHSYLKSDLGPKTG